MTDAYNNNNSFSDKFIAAVGKGGVARANRFRVEFNLPEGIAASGSVHNRNSLSSHIRTTNTRLNAAMRISLLCHTATLPSRDFMTFEVNQYGAPHSMPFTASYMPASFGFYSDDSMSVREYFETWQTTITNIGNNTFNFYDEYTSEVSVVTMDTEGNDKYVVKLYEAWPLSVMPVDYSYSNNDVAQTIMISLRYKYWQASHDTTKIISTV